MHEECVIQKGVNEGLSIWKGIYGRHAIFLLAPDGEVENGAINEIQFIASVVKVEEDWTSMDRTY